MVNKYTKSWTYKCIYTRVYKVTIFIQQSLRNTLQTDSNSTSTFLYFTMQLSLKLDRLGRFLHGLEQIQVHAR